MLPCCQCTDLKWSQMLGTLLRNHLNGSLHTPPRFLASQEPESLVPLGESTPQAVCKQIKKCSPVHLWYALAWKTQSKCTKTLAQLNQTQYSIWSQEKIRINCMKWPLFQANLWSLPLCCRFPSQPRYTWGFFPMIKTLLKQPNALWNA